MDKIKFFIILTTVLFFTGYLLALLLSAFIGKNMLVNRRTPPPDYYVENAFLGYFAPLVVLLPLTTVVALVLHKKRLSPWTVDTGMYIFGVAVAAILALISRDVYAMFTVSILFVLILVWSMFLLATNHPHLRLVFLSTMAVVFPLLLFGCDSLKLN
jgi:hypothetical protein